MTVSDPTPAATEPEETTEVSAPAAADTATEEVIEDDVLVEEISIDGMCGVY